MKIKRILTLSAIGLLLSSTLYLSTTYATLAPGTPPPSGGYDAGSNSILDPGCGPTDTDCFVKPITADNGLTATGSNIQLGGTLLQDSFIETDGNVFAVANGITGGTLDATGLMISTSGAFSTAKLASGSDAENSEVAIQAVTYGAGAYGQILHTNGDTGNIANVSVSNSYAEMHVFDDVQNEDIDVHVTDSGAYMIYRSASFATTQTVGLLVQAAGVESKGSDPTNGYNAIWSTYDPTMFGDTRVNAYLENNGNWQWFNYLNTRDDSGSDTPENFLYTNSSGAVLSAPLSSILGGSSGWSLTGNSGTTSGTNFIGTTDAVDFVIKANSIEMGRFGQIGNIAFGNYNDGGLVGADSNGNSAVTASGQGAMVWGGSVGNYDYPLASGQLSTAWGVSTVASSYFTTAFGDRTRATQENATAFGTSTQANGTDSTAWGENTIASGGTSTAFGEENIASAAASTAWGSFNRARSGSETAFGLHGTDYTPLDTTYGFNGADRLLSIGNGVGSGSESDAFTILKNGQVGIAIDSFETNTNGNIFQIGDGATGVIAYVDSGTGAWVPVSDERKKQNITDLSYNLDTILQLRPVSFDYKRNGEHTIGFLAQQVQGIVPEAVFGDDIKGYGMAYDRLVPVTVKAIQEMNLNITEIGIMQKPNTWRDAITAWLGDITNGVQKIFAHEVQTDKLCVGNTCVNEQQLQQLLQNQNIPSTSPTPNPTPSDPGATPPDNTQPEIDQPSGENPPVVTPDPANEDTISTPPDSGTPPVTDTPPVE